jgi:hypothetical protein
VAKCIIKVDHNGAPKYLEWSSIVDAPVTYGMTLQELRAHIEREQGRQGLKYLDQRLARVEATGTSLHGGTTLEELIEWNRAGPNETCATLAEIVAIYCREG